MYVACMVSNATVWEMFKNACTAALLCNGNAHRVAHMEPDKIARKVWKIGVEYGHSSILEHVTLTYFVDGLSRACLQELARHRHISLSVESTRHGLMNNYEMKANQARDIVKARLSSLIDIKDTQTVQDIAHVYDVVLDAIETLSKKPGAADSLKYLLPEAFTTRLYLTLNLREFIYLVKLRTASGVLPEFQELCRLLVDKLPSCFADFGDMQSLIWHHDSD